MFVSILALPGSVGMTPAYTLDLRRAATNGNFPAVKQILATVALELLDLDQALRLSAGFCRVDIMAYLIEHGATDMDGALYQAACQNKIQAARFLISEERENPATDFDLAIKGAGNHLAVETEFFLLTTQRHYYD